MDDNRPDHRTETEKLRDEVAALTRQLREAERTIDYLRNELGSNHPAGVRRGLFG